MIIQSIFSITQQICSMSCEAWRTTPAWSWDWVAVASSTHRTSSISTAHILYVPQVLLLRICTVYLCCSLIWYSNRSNVYSVIAHGLVERCIMDCSISLSCQSSANACSYSLHMSAISNTVKKYGCWYLYVAPDCPACRINILTLNLLLYPGPSCNMLLTCVL